MKKTVGVLAHVDAGKTTFSERLLFEAHALRRPGRVDNGSAFLDAHPQEKRRGITIFADQALFSYGEDQYCLVDTPGHTDFAAEMERSLCALDYAVVLIDASDGVRGHTETVWKLLEAWNIPTLLFINKLDREGTDFAQTLRQLRRRLSPDIADARGYAGGVPVPAPLAEAGAERDETLLDLYLAGDLCAPSWQARLRALVRRRALFPAFGGAALTGAGVAECLAGLHALSETDWSGRVQAPFRAVVTRVRRDEQGSRLTYLKLTQGCLRPRDAIGEEKVTQIRACHGTRLWPLERAEAGDVVAVTGLTRPVCGEWVGDRPQASRFALEPMLQSTVVYDAARYADGAVLRALETLQEENPALRVAWDESLRAIQVSLMGAIEREVLAQTLRDRFGLDVSFGPSRVRYAETIAAPVCGVGHYEPLRHYAEVRLRLLPAPRGSGVTFESLCYVDTLALSWQRLIQTHVGEKQHKGVRIGAPLTDVRVQLLAGRAHRKHTEGGDFRQATYRAIRQALMQAETVLLEPLCRFSLRIPADALGRIVGELSRIQARCLPPEADDDALLVRGEAVYSRFMAFQQDFASITRGRGALSVVPAGAVPCPDPDAVMAAHPYDPCADDTPDSVFCAHGAGFVVPWHQVEAYAHTQLPDIAEPAGAPGPA